LPLRFSPLAAWSVVFIGAGEAPPELDAALSSGDGDLLPAFSF
jgi:hypothetical protein